MSYPRLQLDPAIDTLDAMLRLALGLGIASQHLAALLRSARSQAPKRVFRRMSLTIFSAHSPAPLAIGSLLAWWQKCLLSQELGGSGSLWRVTVRKRGSAGSRGEARKTDRLPRPE